MTLTGRLADIAERKKRQGVEKMLDRRVQPVEVLE
jgi:hypothetical protein